jgi:hypothetical protein
MCNDSSLTILSCKEAHTTLVIDVADDSSDPCHIRPMLSVTQAREPGSQERTSKGPGSEATRSDHPWTAVHHLGHHTSPACMMAFCSGLVVLLGNNQDQKHHKQPYDPRRSNTASTSLHTQYTSTSPSHHATHAVAAQPVLLCPLTAATCKAHKAPVTQAAACCCCP